MTKSARSTRLARHPARPTTLLGVIMLLVAVATSTAEALTSFIVSPAGPLLLNPGEQFTINIRLSGSSNTLGLGASAYGYPLSLVRFVSGEAVESINHATCVPTYGCSAGLVNTVQDLVEEEIAPGYGRVRFFQGQSVLSTNTNPLDPGLDGVIGGDDAQVRLTFVILGLGTTGLNIGMGAPGDGELFPGGVVDTTALTQLQVSVLPEPGTALLIGLGLAGLASGRNRDHP